MAKCIRIVVVDDHALFRKGLVGLLNDYPEFEVVGEASDGKQALDIIRSTGPDIVLLDVNMPVMDGVDTVHALRAQNLRPKVLMLTISRQEEDLMGSIIAGADGYLLKNAEPEELHHAILRVTEGQSVLSPEVTGQVLHALTRNQQQPDAGNGPLSDRELEVLAAMAHGLTTYQIGTQLFISENTVKTHIRHILEKLEAANRTEAVSKGIQMGLIQRTE